TLSHPAISALLPTFSHLVHLSVLSDGCTSGRQLIDFLSNVHNIKSLIFPDGLGSFQFKGNGRIIGTTPPSFLSHLILVRLPVFLWSEKEQWFVKFLMESAAVMEKLTVKIRGPPLYQVATKRSNVESLQMLARKLNCVLELE
ncbi:hypothetical protein IFM89_031067, partial [Coptis chinensis]